MKPQKILMPFVSYILVLLIGTPSAMAWDTKGQIKNRMKKRYPEIQELKKSVKIGETYLGLVRPVNDKDAKNKGIMEIVTAENSDREMLYEIIAKQNKTTPETVAKTNAHRIFEKAGSDVYFMTKDENWHKKKDLMKKSETKGKEGQ